MATLPVVTREYWVEAERAVKDHSRIIGYGVWHFDHGRHRIALFRVARKGGWEVALHLANTLRDDKNNGIV
jgi:hypothetical protein